jgi:hypothetical protein
VAIDDRVPSGEERADPRCLVPMTAEPDVVRAAYEARLSSGRSAGEDK